MSLRTSRDGTRAVLVIHRADNRDEVYIGVIERTRRDSATIVTIRDPAVRIAPQVSGDTPQLRRVLDVAWADSTDVVVLGQGAGVQPEAPLTISVDGYASTSTTRLENALTVRAAPGQLLVATTGDGIAWQWTGSGSSWQNLGPASAAVFPG